MRDMIDLETQKMALGCEQDSCLAELGGALGVPYMLVSNLGRFGKQYILNIKFVAVEEAKVLGRVNKILADEAKVLEALPKRCKRLSIRRSARLKTKSRLWLRRLRRLLA